MKKTKIEKFGLALEAFGVTITSCGIGDLNQTWLITGMLITGAGRAMAFIGKEEA